MQPGLFFPLYHTNKAVKDFNVLLTLADTFAVLIQKSEQERLQKAERLEVLLAEEKKDRQRTGRE